jgi:hypothetical protein
MCKLVFAKHKKLNWVMKECFKHEMERDLLLLVHNIMAKSCYRFRSESCVVRKREKNAQYVTLFGLL